MVYLFTLLNILNYLDRYLVAAVLPALQAEFGLSHQQGGELQSAFVIGYVIFAPIFGYLGDRISRPRLMAFGACLWSVATLMSGLAPNFYLLAASRILIGVGEASFVTAAPGYIKDRIQDPAKVNVALAIFFAAIPVGAAFGYILGGSMVGPFGWRAAFFTAGVPGIILSGLFLFLKEIRPTISAQVSSVSLTNQVRQILSIPAIRYALIGYTLNSFALNGVATFMVPLGVAKGFEAGMVGSVFGVILVVSGFIGTIGGGKLASFFAAQSIHPIATMLKLIGVFSLISAPLFALAFSGAGGNSFYVSCFLAELIVFAVVAPVNSILVLTSPAQSVTLTQGITVLLLNLFGAFSAPILIGAIADKIGLELALQLATIALVGSGLAWLRGARVVRNTP